jgi:hypothetical protein
MKKTTKKLPTAIPPDLELSEELGQDFGGIPSDVSLTKNIGCASNSTPKPSVKKWKEAE